MYQKKQAKVSTIIVQRAEDVFNESVERVREVHRDGEPQFDGCITVSFDGSWHKQGRTSHYGIGIVTDVLTGLVLDYEVLSKYCHASNWNAKVLGEGSVQFHDWIANHDDCSVNYYGFSNAMGMAKHLWQRSEAKGLRYKDFWTDGDGKALEAVVELNPSGGLPIEKMSEPCRQKNGDSSSKNKK